jgi:hypothetical protein
MICFRFLVSLLSGSYLYLNAVKKTFSISKQEYSNKFKKTKTSRQTSIHSLLNRVKSSNYRSLSRQDTLLITKQKFSDTCGLELSNFKTFILSSMLGFPCRLCFTKKDLLHKKLISSGSARINKSIDILNLVKLHFGFKKMLRIIFT